MHMANEVISAPVALATAGIACAGIALAARRVRREGDDRAVPLMGVLGACAFAAQMVNFPILPGVSAHLGGAAILAILLGPHAAILVMTSILAIQCLVFQDGGLLALGANVLNMGIVPCVAAHVVHRTVAGGAPSRSRLYLACFLAGLAGVVLGAACAGVEIALSGVSDVPPATLLAALLSVHALIGSAEGVATFATISFIGRVRPEVIAGRRLPEGSVSYGALAASLAAAALVLSGVAALFASEWDDGLEHVLARYGVVREERVAPEARVASDVQERIALLPGYAAAPSEVKLDPMTSVAGVLGSLLTIALVVAAGRLVRARAARRRAAGAGSGGVPVGPANPAGSGACTTS